MNRSHGIVAEMADRFYVNCPLQPGLVCLQGAEAHHLATVCRLHPGDVVCLFNGDGHEYPARVEQVTKQCVFLAVLGAETTSRELGFHIEIAAPLPKGDRAQFLLEKLTELGVTSFVPLITHRSVLRPGRMNLEKLRRYVVEASKQCGRNRLLQVQSPIKWKDYCGQNDLPRIRRVAHVSAASIAAAAREAQTLAVGPEGGFTDEEVALACQQGWEIVGLGPRILRIETAALVLAACAVYGVLATQAQYAP